MDNFKCSPVFVTKYFDAPGSTIELELSSTISQVKLIKSSRANHSLFKSDSNYYSRQGEAITANGRMPQDSERETNKCLLKGLPRRKAHTLQSGFRDK